MYVYVSCFNLIAMTAMILCLLIDNKWNIIFLCVDNAIKSTSMCLTHAKFTNHTILCLSRKRTQEIEQQGKNGENKIQSYVIHVNLKWYIFVLFLFCRFRCYCPFTWCIHRFCWLQQIINLIKKNHFALTLYVFYPYTLFPMQIKNCPICSYLSPFTKIFVKNQHSKKNSSQFDQREFDKRVIFEEKFQKQFWI